MYIEKKVIFKYYENDIFSWVPGKNSRVCSSHFVGGEKSNNPLHPAYVPSVFPDCYKEKAPSLEVLERFKRFEARQKKKEQVEENHLEDSISFSNDLSSFNDTPNDFSANVREISVQTDFDLLLQDSEESDFDVLLCFIDANESATQTCLNTRKTSKENTITIVKECKCQRTKTKSTAVGPDCSGKIFWTGFSAIESSGEKRDEEIKKFTGIDWMFFNVLLNFIIPGAEGQESFYKKVGQKDRLLLFLMKMKLGLPFTVLGSLFSVSRTTASNIFVTVLKTLRCKTASWIFWPSREAIKASAPVSFCNYPYVRGILDCTELRCDTPPTVEQRVLMFSSYKNTFTVKFLVVISPSGMITFISKGYGGKATDSYIVNDSGFLNLLEPGDEVMADKGFPEISVDLLQKNCTLVMPPFAVNPQFTREEVLTGYSIASVRIHVERAIQRIKIFKILQHISIELLNHIDDIIFVAAVLANNKEPLIKK